MSCSYSNISNLKGIEYFTALEYLYCDNNSLTSLDISKNTRLSDLNCSYNSLSSLNVTNNPALESLYCYNNNLSSLNVTNNPALQTLYCQFNNLSSLNVSSNTQLTKLGCSNNNLSSLNVSSNTQLDSLYCYNNNLSSLDVSKNTQLTYLYCGNNNLSSLNVTNNPALQTLYCQFNNLTSLDLRNQFNLTTLYCYGNQITTLDVLNCPDTLTSSVGYYPDGDYWSATLACDEGVTITRNGTQPLAHLDTAEGGKGKITVSGWAFDWDNVNAAVAVHMYVGGPAGSGAKAYGLKANTSRADIDRAYPGAGTNHGFNTAVTVTERGQQTLYFYAIDPNGALPAKHFATKTVTIEDPGTQPLAHLDVAENSDGKLHVSGWAFDWDNVNATVTVHVYVGGPAGSGANGYAVKANTSRPDINNAYPGAGTNHGFNTTLTVSERGQQTLYFYAIDPQGYTQAKLFATKTVAIGKQPLTKLDAAEGGDGTIKVSGWTFDWDDVNATVPVHIYVGGPAGSGAKAYGVQANASRPDVNNAYPGAGTNHGFNTTLTVSERGQQTLYFYAIDQVSGLPAKLFATKTVTITDPGRQPLAHLDVAENSDGKLHVSGWAFDWDNVNAAVAVHVYVGGPAGSGAKGYSFKANTSRPDLNNAYPGAGTNHGFNTTIAVSERGKQTLYFYAIDPQGKLPAKQFATQTVTIGRQPVARVDSAQGGEGMISVSGWAFDWDDVDSTVPVVVCIGGPYESATSAYVVYADASRPDIDRAYPGAGTNHGFNSTIYVSERGTQTLCFYAIDRGGLPDKLIATKTVNIKAPTNGTYRALLIGEVHFTDDTCNRNWGDVNLMANMLSSRNAPGGGKYVINTRRDLNNAGVKSAISSCFAGATENDVSLFFIATHGDATNTGRYAGALALVNDDWIMLDELAECLSAVPGKVIVILESCGSGAAVYANGAKKAQQQANAAFNDAVIQAFAARDTVITSEDDFMGTYGINTGEFRVNNKFYVLTASAYQQLSWGTESGPYNYFTKWLTEGIGTTGEMPADSAYGNANGICSLEEAYHYVSVKGDNYPFTGGATQQVQRYPMGSTYPLLKK